MDTTYDAFVSHNGLDKPIVERLCWALLEAGVRPWFDKWDLAPGDVWIREVERVLGQVPAVIVCLGEHGLSAWHDAERQAALNRATSTGAGTVVPVLLPGAPRAVELPAFLLNWHPVDLRAEPAWDDGIARLVASLTGKALPQGPWVDEGRERPYRGLQPFTEADAGWMFGRDKEERELLDALREGQRFVTVVGASGSGKSSLVRAGVVPAVRTGAFDGRPWQALVMRPGAQPCHALAVRLEELRRSVEGTPADVAAEGEHLAALREQLLGSESTLSDVADLLLDRDDRDERLLLVVDQFEELFIEPTRAATNGADPTAPTTKLAPEAAALLRNLLHATDREGGRVRVMTTLRADFTGDALAVPELGRHMARTSFALPPMAAEQLRNAIRRPALLKSYDVETAVVDALVSATADQAGRLPLLQHALDRLWDARDQGKRRLTYAAYSEHVGGIEDAVAKQAESVFASLVKQASDHEAVVRRVFLRLVHLVEGTRHTRRRLRRSELSGDAAAIAVLEAFVDARLVVTDELREREDAPPEQVAEIAHEALMVRWSRLRRWLDESREALRMRQEIELDAKQWRQRGRSADELWRGGHLAHAWETLEREGIDLSPDERAFLDASKAAEIAERQAEARRQRWQLATTTGASVVLLASLVVAIVQCSAAGRLAEHNEELALQKDQEAARAERLAKDASHKTRLEQSARASLLVAVPGKELEALELAVRTVGEELAELEQGNEGGRPPAAIAQGLHDALVHAHEVVVLRGHTNTVTHVRWSPDGTRLATASDDATARLWNVETGAEPAILQGHTDRITWLGWTADGSRLATASDDETARIWDGETGAALAALQGHVGPVVDMAWSPDGARLVTLSSRSAMPGVRGSQGEPKLWDGRTGALLATLAGHERSAVDVAWSPDGTRLATAHAGKEPALRLWDGTTGAELAVMRGHAEEVVDVTWSRDGKRLATASMDDTARLWDVDTGAAVATLAGHEGDVGLVEWSSDGARLVTASSDKTVRLWDGATGEALASLLGDRFELVAVQWAPGGERLAAAGVHGGGIPDTATGELRIWGRLGDSLLNLQGHTGVIMASDWSHDGNHLATASWDQTARIWDAETGAQLAVLGGHTQGVVAVAWAPDGKRVATGSVDGTARVWDMDTAERLATLRGHEQGMVMDVEWAPDGTRLATASEDATVRLWDRKTATAFATLAHAGWARDVAWSPDGTRLATASEEQAARLWDARTGKETASLQGHTDAVVAVAWSPDGTRLATASKDDTARIWDAATLGPLASLQGHTADVWWLAWAPDGTRLATGSNDKTTRIWDAAAGTELAVLRGHTGVVSKLAWAPDGTRLATASIDGTNDTGRVWSAGTGEQLAALDESVLALAWAPDGEHLVTGGGDGTVRLWNTTPVKPLTPHPGHTSSIMDVEWAPDGTRFATVGHDYVAKLWDGETGLPIATFHGHEHELDVVAWSPDGRALATASKDGTVRLWPGTLRGWLERACETLEASSGAVHVYPETRKVCAAQRTAPSP